MHKIEAKFSKSLAKAPFDTSRVECLLLSSDAFEAAFKKRSWMSTDVEIQLAKKLAALKDEKSEKKSGEEKTVKEAPKVDALKTPSFDSLKVHFSQGGESIALALPKESFTTFEFFTALRKAFAGFFTEGAKHDILVDLSDIARKSESLQLSVVEAFGHLSESCDWKPMGFGKKSEAKSKFKELKFEFVSNLAPKKLQMAFDMGRVKARACNYVRTLTEMPPNELNPEGYRKHIDLFVKKHGLKQEFFDTAKLSKMGANAFLAVVRADPNSKGGISKITYSPKIKAKKKIALVGKGLCFDTGGYNVKTGDFMHGMHGDMMGSAVALAALEAFKELNLPYEVTSYLAIAENLISPTGFKPNEVIVAMNGMSIEVVDTDAEGRMVLSDTLTLASREKPDLIIDYATLTGSVIRALDRRRSGIYTNQMKYLSMALEAGEQSGERVWGFPIGRDYLEVLKSEHADIKQCNPAWNADHIYAATFLSRFVESDVPWFHMDLAASESKGGLGLVTTDTTGFGIGWTLSFVESFFKRAK